VSPDTSAPAAPVLARPRYARSPAPAYPLGARRLHQQGLVLLRVEVTEDGRPAEVTIAQSCGFPVLDDAALRAVRSWEFDPARIGERAIASQIEVPVRFALD